MKNLDKVLLIGLVVITAITDFFVSSSLGHIYPEVPRVSIDQLPCYIETVDGRVLNLSSICGKNPAFTPNLILSPNSMPTPSFTPTPSPTFIPIPTPSFTPTPSPTFIPTPMPSSTSTPSPTPALRQ